MIYAILGPTASQKSDLAEKISSKYNFPIINFDVFQMYKELNIGTAKPSNELLNSGRYFLYNNISLKDPYDVAYFQEDGRNLLKKFNNDNVILVGGNGLYLKALLFDYKFKDEKPMPNNYMEECSNEELYKMLLKIDHEDALKIGSNNRKRLLRALYIYETHNKNKTELNEGGKDNLLYPNTIFVGIDLDRNILYERINKRVDLMFQNGLKEEVKEIIRNYGSDSRAFQAIGYKEFLFNLDDDETKDLIKKNTRNYAKRQMTFFKHQYKNINWFKNIDLAEKFLVKEISNNG